MGQRLGFLGQLAILWSEPVTRIEIGMGKKHLNSRVPTWWHTVGGKKSSTVGKKVNGRPTDLLCAINPNHWLFVGHQLSNKQSMVGIDGAGRIQWVYRLLFFCPPLLPFFAPYCKCIHKHTEVQIDVCWCSQKHTHAVCAYIDSLELQAKHRLLIEVKTDVHAKKLWHYGHAADNSCIGWYSTDC